MVHFTVRESSCFFNLHIRGEYEINHVTLLVDGQHAATTFAINKDYEYLTIYSDFQIPENSEIKAEVKFRNSVPTGTRGMYLAYYTNPEGLKKEPVQR